jgi:cell wall-associated NlpC family hydrolase
MRKTPGFSDLIGKPFAYGGRGPDFFDCYGLLMEMKRREGVVIPDYKSPEELQKIALVIESEKRLWTAIPRPRPGCAVAIRVGRFVAHVGYMIDSLHMLHTWEKSGGVMYEPLEQSIWVKRIAGYYEFAPC